MPYERQWQTLGRTYFQLNWSWARRPARQLTGIKSHSCSTSAPEIVFSPRVTSLPAPDIASALPNLMCCQATPLPMPDSAVCSRCLVVPHFLPARAIANSGCQHRVA